MKKLLIFLIALLSMSAHAQSQKEVDGAYANAGRQHWTLYAGAGQESVTSPRKVVVNLQELGGFYRFTNGIMLGGFTQQGYTNNYTPNHATNFTVATLGYGTRVGSFTPYVVYGQGWRSVNGSTANYNQVQAGTNYNINQTWYVGAQYRYRNSGEISNWRTNRYLGTVGYNIDKNWSVNANYGKTYGSWESNQYYAGVVYKF
jgi:hypothetical protein